MKFVEVIVTGMVMLTQNLSTSRSGPTAPCAGKRQEEMATRSNRRRFILRRWKGDQSCVRRFVLCGL
jgi:hypothetical protein